MEYSGAFQGEEKHGKAERKGTREIKSREGKSELVGASVEGEKRIMLNFYVSCSLEKK